MQAKSFSDYDYLLKILIIGNSGVGKSCMLLRFADDTYSNTYISTIGVDFRIRTVEINGKIVKLQLWDTAGQERFRTITSSYYRGAHGIIIAFDTTDVQSFEDIKSTWCNEIERYSNEDVRVILAGTKGDLKSNISEESILRFAKEHNMDYIKTSAKNNTGINEVFTNLAETILENSGHKLNKNGTHTRTSEKAQLDIKNAYSLHTPKNSCC